MVGAALWAIAVWWRTTKDLIELGSPLSNDVLHVIAGLVIFIAVAMLAKGDRRWLTAWLAVLTATLLNELVDIATERWPNITDQYLEAAHDFCATLAFPTAALLLLFVCNGLAFSRGQDG